MVSGYGSYASARQDGQRPYFIGTLMCRPIHQQAMADCDAVRQAFNIAISCDLREGLRTLGGGDSARTELLVFGNETARAKSYRVEQVYGNIRI